MTQADLALRIDMSVQMVQQIERGATAPGFDTIDALSRALAAPPALMFPATRPEKTPSAKDETVSAITARAAGLTQEDAETLLALAAHLGGRGRRR